MKSIYFKNFTATAAMVVLSFFILGLAFVFLGRSYVINNYRTGMQANAEEVRHNALAMAHDPKLLCVQDIERDLTEHEAHQLCSLLRDLASKRGVTVVCGVIDYDLGACFDTVTCITDETRAQQGAWLRKHQAREVA